MQSRTNFSVTDLRTDSQCFCNLRSYLCRAAELPDCSCWERAECPYSPLVVVPVSSCVRRSLSMLGCLRLIYTYYVKKHQVRAKAKLTYLARPGS